MSESSIPNVIEIELKQPESEGRFQELKQSLLQMAGRGVLALSLVSGVGVAASTTVEVIGAEGNLAYAVTDDYPDKDAYDCSATYGKSSWCKGGSDNSPRGYAYRNCTDWAAWRIPQITGKPVPAGLSHGGLWADKAVNFGAEVDNRPEVGDAAVFSGGSWGHVAVVESVNSNGTVNISQYNTGYLGKFSTASGVIADKYIDFTPDVNEGTGSRNTTIKQGGVKRSDFNGTGRSDILLYTPGPGNDSVLYGKEDKGVFERSVYPIEGDYQVAAGDYNGDKRSDFFLYGDRSVRDFVFYGQSDPGVFHKHEVSIDGHYDQITPGDFNGDAIDDVFLYAVGTGADKVMSGTRIGGNFEFNTASVQLEANYKITSGKYNEDGRSDVFLYNEQGADYVLTGRDARGQFGRYPLDEQIEGIYERPVSGDFNDDGRDDVLLYGYGLATDKVFYGRERPGDYGVYPTSIQSEYRPIATGDYNGDGHDDVVMHGPGAAMDRVLYGTNTVGDFHPVPIDLSGDYKRINT